MKKLFNKSIDIRSISFNDGDSVYASITRNILTDWCLHLTLLKERLVDSIVVKENATHERVELTCTDSDHCSFISKSDRLSLSLSSRDLDNLHYFLLEFYRDGYASVDHIDLQTENGGYITFQIET